MLDINKSNDCYNFTFNVGFYVEGSNVEPYPSLELLIAFYCDYRNAGLSCQLKLPLAVRQARNDTDLATFAFMGESNERYCYYP